MSQQCSKQSNTHDMEITLSIPALNGLDTLCIPTISGDTRASRHFLPSSVAAAAAPASPAVLLLLMMMLLCFVRSENVDISPFVACRRRVPLLKLACEHCTETLANGYLCGTAKANKRAVLFIATPVLHRTAEPHISLSFLRRPVNTPPLLENSMPKILRSGVCALCDDPSTIIHCCRPSIFFGRARPVWSVGCRTLNRKAISSIRLTLPLYRSQRPGCLVWC